MIYFAFSILNSAFLNLEEVMSLEFSQELDTPIISPSYAPQDAAEIGLRPKLLAD